MFNLKKIPTYRLAKCVALASVIALTTACSGGGGGGSSSGGSGGGTNNNNQHTKPTPEISIVTPRILKPAGEEVLISGKKLKEAIVTFESNNLSPTTQTDTLIKVAFPAKATGDYQVDIDGQKFAISYFNPSYTKVVSGAIHSCGILPSKKVECWGNNFDTQTYNDASQGRIRSPKLVAGLENVTDLALGASHSCALLADKTVKCWGRKDNGLVAVSGSGKQGTPTLIAGLTNVSAISAGRHHSCAIIGEATATTDSTVKCWGANNHRQINENNNGLYTAPTDVNLGASLTRMTKAIQVSVGNESTCFLLSDKTVQCRGRNNVGQTGGYSASLARDFKLMNIGSGAASKAKQIVSGDNHHCALRADNTVVCWGLNSFGQLGDNTTVTSTSGTPKYPVVVHTSASSATPLANVKRIAAGGNFTCAQLTSGSMKCWGDNTNYQLGNRTGANSSTPVDVRLITNATGLAVGSATACASFANAMPKCWGTNSEGQVGANSLTATFDTPEEVASRYSQQKRPKAGLDTVVAASGGDFFYCALLADGHIKCWGPNHRGQLGNGSTSYSNAPVNVMGISNAKQIASGYEHSCAVLDDGTIKCWGLNRFGQLGNNTTMNSSQPTAVNNINNAVQVVTGFYHTCALLQDKKVKCWGASSAGQFALPAGKNGREPVDIAGLTNVTKLSANMGSHTCALTEAGKVMCWGSNNKGQLGDGLATSGSNTTPKAVVGISNAIDIAVGNAHSCALLNDKTVKCWGGNNNGALGVGKGNSYVTATPELISNLTGVKKIRASSDFSCAVLDDNSAKCWGANNRMQLGDGTRTTRNTPVSLSVLKGKIDDMALSVNGTLAIQGTLISTVN